MIKRRLASPFSIALLFLLIATTAVSPLYARLVDGPTTELVPTIPAPVRPLGSSSLSLAASDELVGWPTFYGVQITDKLAASFNCFGQLGHRYMPAGIDTSIWPDANFVVYPSASTDYLFGGGIWVGGIVGNDTLVSTAVNGVTGGTEMFPTGYGPTNRLGTVGKIYHVSDYAMRAEFSDTINAGIVYPIDFFGRPHQPLNLRMVNRSHIWNDGDRAFQVIYDLLITNVGDESIREGYVAIILDADIGSRSSPIPHIDDFVGSIRSQGIGYMVDNDGDPVSHVLIDSISSTRIIAARFLWTSFEATDTSFNWWANITAGGTSFGPRRRENFRDFGTGHIGSPHGDENRYHLLSSGEWDYDQVMTGSIGSSDSVWSEPPPVIAADIVNGADTRFLLSIGSFDLPPDSSVRVIFTTLTADSVISRTDLWQFINTFPEMYDDALNLEFITDKAASSDSMANELVNPLNPVTGQQIFYSDADSAVIEWDPWGCDNVQGYALFLSPVSSDDIPCPGVIPPWLQPDSLVEIAQVDNGYQYTFRDLEPYQLYLCNVAHVAGGQLGDPGRPFAVSLGRQPQPPTPNTPFVFVRGVGLPVLNWEQPGTETIREYRIYRFVDSLAATRRYTPFYDQGYFQQYRTPVDSFHVDGSTYYYYAMQPIAIIPGDQLEWIDSSGAAGEPVYLVTAIGGNNFESDFSTPIAVEWVPEPSRDVLVLTYSSTVSTSNIPLDSIRGFYDDVLSDYDYDLVVQVDSTTGGDCGEHPFLCLDWHAFMLYETVIVDDGFAELIMTDYYESSTSGFQRYIRAGGRLLYFGSLEGLEHSGMSAPPEFNDNRHSFTETYLGADSVYHIGAGYYTYVATVPYLDSLAGFGHAEGAVEGAPDIAYGYDTTISALQGDLQPLWPAHTPPEVAAFVPSSSTTVTHRYRSIYPSSSVVEGAPVGLHTEHPTGETYAFGFHLWYMNRSHAKALIDWIIPGSPTAVDSDNGPTLPTQVALYPNYPNPFNPTTSIRFDLPHRATVRLTIHNILGQTVTTLVNSTLAAGSHEVVWNGRSQSSHSAATGIYFYRLEVGSEVKTRKMLLLK